MFRDLICIPPHCNVDGAPERHRFIYNFEHEVSLHSDPAIVPSLTFEDVYSDQLQLIEGDEVVTAQNVEEYSNGVLKALVGGRDANQVAYAQTLDYFDSRRRALLEARGTNDLMASLRALAQTVRTMTGVEMLLTARTQW
jgi:hypothetical protein